MTLFPIFLPEDCQTVVYLGPFDVLLTYFCCYRSQRYLDPVLLVVRDSVTLMLSVSTIREDIVVNV